MFEWLKKLVKPIDAGTLVRVIKQKVSPEPTDPSLEEFVSPLREELKEQLAIKPDIGYAPLCANCRAHQVVDQHIAEAVAEKEDPQPWLVNLHSELIATRQDLKAYRTENRILRTDLEAVRSDVNPIKRMLYLFGAGLAGLTAKAFWDLWLQQQIVNILPFLLPLIP
jgi:hypothetical protein